MLYILQVLFIEGHDKLSRFFMLNVNSCTEAQAGFPILSFVSPVAGDRII
jgi:hypothetical protein